MAVQAQLPCNAFSPDIRTRRDDVVLFHEQQQQILDGSSNLLVGTALSDHPKSELTCNNNASTCRKRSRGVLASMALPLSSTPPPHMNNNQALLMPTLQSRLYASAGTSTSGRPSSVPLTPTLSQDLASHFYQETLEVDSLVRLQMERLRSGLEQASKRQCRALLSAVEQQVWKRLREKESELESASRKNLELEEKVRMLSAENQIWFGVARNNEAIASSLRAALEQVVLQNGAAPPPAKEGYGDSQEEAPLPADDAQSCCFEEEDAFRGCWGQKKRVVCKACGEREVCVLLLPCRHLCLCKECEPTLDTCPICSSTKKASLQIFLSS